PNTPSTFLLNTTPVRHPNRRHVIDREICCTSRAFQTFTPPPRTVDNDQDVVDLMADDITDLTAHTDLADRGQLVQASIWLLSVATQQAASFSQAPRINQMRHACSPIEMTTEEAKNFWMPTYATAPEYTNLPSLTWPDFQRLGLLTYRRELGGGRKEMEESLIKVGAADV
ncbi:hypothetical protein QL093DRAFT_2027035, partial [Fusarium oxysporum]